jgi:hypothetical protein
MIRGSTGKRNLGVPQNGRVTRKAYPMTANRGQSVFQEARWNETTDNRSVGNQMSDITQSLTVQVES